MSLTDKYSENHFCYLSGVEARFLRGQMIKKLTQAMQYILPAQEFGSER